MLVKNWRGLAALRRVLAAKQTQITSYVLKKTIENFSYFLSVISLVVPVNEIRKNISILSYGHFLVTDTP